MMQDELFHEDWRDSLRHVVKALGGFEAVGQELWPKLSRKKGGDWLSDCLNPERPAKLDIEDIEALLRLGREHGVHCAMYHLCDSVQYQRPDTVEPEDERARLQREFVEAKGQLESLLKRMEQLG